MKLLLQAAVAVSLLSVATVAHGETATKQLAVGQPASNQGASKLPYCSKTVTTNCRKHKSRIGLYAAAGAAAGVAVAVFAAGSGEESVSP